MQVIIITISSLHSCVPGNKPFLFILSTMHIMCNIHLKLMQSYICFVLIQPEHWLAKKIPVLLLSWQQRNSTTHSSLSSNEVITTDTLAPKFKVKPHQSTAEPFVYGPVCMVSLASLANSHFKFNELCP